MAQTVKLAEYLFARLRQLGAEAIHGVPGDYNLTLLDYVEPADLLWVGNASELNAGYAADGYARLKGLGALITTFGVGELSAINAVACAYTEHAAVVHIVGTPSRTSQEARLLVHHTLGDGDYRHFEQMYTHVTVAQANLLDPQTAGEQIDGVLRQCLIHSRPIYLEVPEDMVDAQLPAERLNQSIELPQVKSQNILAGALAKVINRIYQAGQPIIMVDHETRALGLVEHVQKLVDATQWPTFTTVSGKSLVDMTSPNVYGIYKGAFADSTTKAFVEGSDLVLCFGPHNSSINTYSWSTLPKADSGISFTDAGIHIDGTVIRDAPTRQLLQQLVQSLDYKKIKRYTPSTDLPRDRNLSFSESTPADMIRQDKVWRLLASILRPGDILLAETGTASYGIRDVLLPKYSKLFISPTWLSIGYMLPACQGASLAQRELIRSDSYHGLNRARTILIIGDGSFQVTVQELATIIRHKLDVIVFLINNDGYTTERCIHGMNESYNDISSWQYLKLPSAFGAPEDCFMASVKTYGDLEAVLNDPRLADGDGLRMVEIVMDRNDAPAGPLLELLDKQRDHNQ